jgi:hypothetical protein
MQQLFSDRAHTSCGQYFGQRRPSVAASLAVIQDLIFGAGDYGVWYGSIRTVWWFCRPTATA